MKRLAHLLRSRRAQILEQWRRAVVSDAQVPVAPTLSEPALRDHVPEIMDAIIEALERGLVGGEAAEGRALAETKMPRVHALERFAQGYSLAAMLRELSHLRTAIVDSYWNEPNLDARGVRFLHAALDECAAIAAVELERADHERLQSEVDVRERFVAILGHDLRSPLNTVKMVNGVLLHTATEAQNELIGRSVRAVERMRKMIEQLLDFTKVRGGELVLERASIHLGQLCDEIVEELRVGNPDRTVMLDVTGAVEGAFDRGRIGQVVSNLLSNALAYSPRDTTVRVSVAGEERDVVVRVHNDGRPIPKESQAQIFEAFHRGEIDSENTHGIGLGLYIASEIVHAHGGTISVESEADRGTTFTVRLPR